MSYLNQLGVSRKRWKTKHIEPLDQIKEVDSFLYGGGATTVSTLLGSGRKAARARQVIYEKWSAMESDAICSTAMDLLVTNALGSHETTGDMVFIEQTPLSNKNKQLSKIVDDISSDLSELFNKVAVQSAYTATVFGDSYARIYTGKKTGVIDLYIDEMVRPPLVQPYERGSKTIGFVVYTGGKNFERLDNAQMARLKMPRKQWVAQHGVVEKALRIAITEDNMLKLPVMPAMAGGSLLYPAEESYDNLTASLMGVVGQRWMDSIDEEFINLNMDGMTKEQQEKFKQSAVDMFKNTKRLSEAAVKEGRPVLEKIRHILPSWGEKQLTNLNIGTGSSGRNSSITIDDVMLHAKLLAGALGVDLSLLGFSEILSGGLGEGGFFRVSAQAAERARIIRNSLELFFNSIIDIHTLNKYGLIYSPKERPWKINFYGSISAIESENERTKADRMSGGLLLVQGMQQFKDMGANKDMLFNFLSKQMMLDEDQARLYSGLADMVNEGVPDESI